jgi:hypothetical protein
MLKNLLCNGLYLCIRPFFTLLQHVRFLTARLQPKPLVVSNWVAHADLRDEFYAFT